MPAIGSKRKFQQLFIIVRFRARHSGTDAEEWRCPLATRSDIKIATRLSVACSATANLDCDILSMIRGLSAMLMRRPEFITLLVVAAAALPLAQAKHSYDCAFARR
jgi:hypothetical protein